MSNGAPLYLAYLHHDWRYRYVNARMPSAWVDPSRRSSAPPLVAMHGGHAPAHSDGPGSGSEFIVTLPRDVS